ncbi:hypothetical protein ACVW0P_001835 [Mucilaginibacter sp. UYNi724]
MIDFLKSDVSFAAFLLKKSSSGKLSERDII